MEKTKHKFKFNRLFITLVNGILFLFMKYFRVKGNINNDIKNIKGPFLLLANHIGTYDPFVVNHFIKQPVHFVASDAVFKDRWIGFLFRKLGVIPKVKNSRDTKVIRDMISVIKSGESIGLFPSGTRSWTGTSLPFDPAIAKLVKLLKVPVITAKMKGMQLTNPRWSLRLRRSTVEVDYELALTTPQIKEASLEQIMAVIQLNIGHDEVEYQREKRIVIQSEYRAEFIEHVLFLCPICNCIGEIKSNGNNFQCKKCECDVHVNPYGFFETKGGFELPYDNIRDGFQWQRTQFESFVEKHFVDRTTASLFSDQEVAIYKEVNQLMILQGKAVLTFYIDRVLISFEDASWEFFIKNIEMINPQFHERIEVTYQNKNYRFVGESNKISGLKWEIACSVIWKLTGQEQKTSTYLQ